MKKHSSLAKGNSSLSLVLPHAQVYGLPERKQLMLWVGIMLVGLLVMILNFEKYQVGAHYDDAAYITLARSILSADHYGLINYPGDPQTWNYPFGFPLLLAPFALLQPIFQDSLNVFKVLSILATLANASLLFWGWGWLTRRLSYWWCLGVTSLYLFSPITIDLSGRVMSEPIFMTFYLLAMLLVERIVARKARGWEWVVLAFALTFVIFIRTIGIVLIIALLAYLLLAMGKRSLKPILVSLSGVTLITILIVVITPVRSVDLIPTRYLSDQQAEMIVSIFRRFTPEPGTSPPDAQIDQGESTETPPQSVNGVPDRSRSFGKIFYDYIVLGIPQRFGDDLRSLLIPLGGGNRERALFAKLGVPFMFFVVGFLISGITIFGYFRWYSKEKITVFNLSSVIYFFSLFLWVWNEERFLSPIHPQLALALLLGVQGLLNFANGVLDRQGSRIFQNISIAKRSNVFRQSSDHDVSSDSHMSSDGRTSADGPMMLIVFVLSLTALSFIKSVYLADSYQHTGDLAVRTQWIRENTPETSVILSEYPLIDYLQGNRSTVRYPVKPMSSLEYLDYIREERVNYILVAPSVTWMNPKYIPSLSEDMSALLPTLAALAAEHKISEVFASPQDRIIVYQVFP